MADKQPSNTITQRWAALSAKQRRAIVVGTMGAALLFAIYLFVTASPPKHRTGGERQAIVSDILTSANTRKLGIDGLNNRTRDLEGKIRDLKSKLSDLSSQIDEASDKAVSKSELKAEFDKLSQTLRQARQDKSGQTPAPVDNQVPPSNTPPVTATPPPSHDNIWARQAPVAEISPQQGKGQGGKDQAAKPAPVSPIKIRVIGQTDAQAEAAAKAKAAHDIGVYMPAGSIITGTLITGMEAPTSKAAQTDPFPSLVRIKKDAILPNRYRLDVRECFIIASGYGSLSAERAYLRAEVLSCVRDDGGVIEVPLNAYAVGEDGKVGLRGRVVSKQGQFLAKSLMAGFWSGMSQVFRRVPVPTIQTSPGSDPLYQNVLSTDSLTSGVVRGAGMALDRLAKFYLNMAKDIYPVIEINANRRVSFIVTKGGRLRTVSAKNNQHGQGGQGKEK